MWTFLYHLMLYSSASPKDAWVCGKNAWASVMTLPLSSHSQTRIQVSFAMESVSTSTAPSRSEYPRRREKAQGPIELGRDRKSPNPGMHLHPKRKWALRVRRVVLHCRLQVQSLPQMWLDHHAVSGWPKAAIALGTALWLLCASLVIIPSFPPFVSVCTPSRNLWTAVVRDCWARSWGFLVGCRGMLRGKKNFFLLLFVPRAAIVCMASCGYRCGCRSSQTPMVDLFAVLIQDHSRKKKFWWCFL